MVPKLEEPITLPQTLVLRPEVPEVAPQATRAHKVEVGGKNTYLTRTLFTEFGSTQGCPACEVMQRTHGPAKGIHHSQACRARLESDLESDRLKGQKLEADRK